MAGKVSGFLCLSSLLLCLAACGGASDELDLEDEEEEAVQGFSEEETESSENSGGNNGSVTASSLNFEAGLLFGDQGIEPGTASDCEAGPSNRCWYVDANAPDGGDGSFALPYNSFEQVVGYRTTSSSYVTGLLQGGDHLYVTGTFDMDQHVDDGGKAIRLYFGNPSQGGTSSNPTVVKSYKGQARAVFDGKFRRVGSMDHETAGLIEVRTSFATPIDSIVIQNIEVQNASGIGIAINENVLNVEMVSVVVHDTALVDGASSRGGVHFRMTARLTNYLIRNSLLYSNYRNENGVGYYSSTSNNIGGVNILTAPEADNGSRVVVRNNVFLDEFYAIRHKHSGDVITEIYSNYIDEANIGVFVRAYTDNIIHHNIMKDVGIAFYLEAENQNGNMIGSFYNNTVINSNALVDTGFETSAFTRSPNFYNNIFISSSDDGDDEYPIVLGKYGSNNYALSQWTSSHNIFDIAGTTLLRHEGSSFVEADSLAMLADTTSSVADIIFVNENDDLSLADYTLAAGSAGHNAGDDGRDVGAIHAD